jgi:rare lipoprotein A
MVSLAMMDRIAFRRVFWLVVLLATVILNGCSHVRTKDGPPNFYVDETKIPNAVPKPEPLSRIGNKPYYTVFGTRYYVMSDSKNYEERGIASWYGTQFHTRHTSNGERYNMLSMTAAHKTLPLPTYVQVTNLKNNKQVIVKVNDRGPFESNRLIDLSYVAAKKLGMLGRGTAYVDVKAIDPVEWQLAQNLANHHRTVTVTHTVTRSVTHYAKTKNVYTRMQMAYYLQVGLFHKKNYAEQMRRHVMGMVSTPVTVKPNHNIYRVQIGPFRDVASVQRMSKRLKAVGVSCKRFEEENEML